MRKTDYLKSHQQYLKYGKQPYLKKLKEDTRALKGLPPKKDTTSTDDIQLFGTFSTVKKITEDTDKSLKKKKTQSLQKKQKQLKEPKPKRIKFKDFY